MATIAENLSLLQQTKNDIKTAIESKGQDLTNVPFTQYANKIKNIGNGSETQVSDEIVYSDVDNGDEISITLSQLQQVKNDIKTAIENKGQDLTDVPFTGYANKIMNIVIEQEPSGTVGLVYSGLDSNGNITTDETAIVSYMIGDGTTTDGNGYTGTDTDIVIPETYNGLPVIEIGQYAFRNKTAITKISIPLSVKTIDNYAFYGCRSLTEINIPKSVTTIGEGAFNICISLTSVKIPNSVTSIGNSAFSNCANLTSINIPSTVTTIGNSAFNNCKDLTLITVEDGNMAYKDDNGKALLTKDGTTLISYANMSGTSYIIPDSVTSIGNSAFNNCTNLTSINIPSTVTTIGNSAFKGCTGLTSITIPEGVVEIDHAVFYGCSSLTSITIPEGVAVIVSQAFEGCLGLTSIEIPSTVTTIGIYAFYGCSNLTEMTMLPTTPPTLSSTSVISTATTTIYVPYESLEAYQTATNWSEFADIMVGFGEPQGTEGLVYTGLNSSGTVVTDEAEIVSYMIGDNTTTNGNGYIGIETDVIIPSTYNGKPVTQIGQYAFRNKTELTSITIPSSVTKINNYAFRDVTGTITFADGTVISSLGGFSFQNSTGTITGLVLGGGITSIGGYAFQDCTGLSSITIPVTLTTINPTVFLGCKGLTSISVEEGNPTLKDDNGRAILSTNGTQLVVYANESGTEYTIPSSVTTLGESAFRKCDNLISVTIPSSVRTFNQYVFYDCLNLETVYFESGSLLTELPYGTFRNDAKLTSINIPSSVTTIGNYALYGTGFSLINLPTSLTTIGAHGMRKMTNLTSIILPTRLTTIEEYAFYGCTSLTSITIPDSVTSIGGYTFSGCTSLTEMTMLSTTPPTLESSSAISSATQVINIPSGTYATYSTATNWSNYANIMVDPARESWKTVWTGSLELSYNKAFGGGYSVITETATGVRANTPTRVSGTANYTKTNTFTNRELNYEDGENGTAVVSDSSSSIASQPQYVIAPTVANQISARVGRASGNSAAKFGVVITEIQQYY